MTDKLVIGTSTAEDGSLKVHEAASPRAPRLSQEEQESRQAIKRFKRQKRSERLSARQRGQSMGLQRAKRIRKMARQIEREYDVTPEEARKAAKIALGIESNLIVEIAKLPKIGASHGA